MNTLKQDIKTLADQQPELKNQRKTVHRVGEKILYPYPEGSWQHTKGLFQSPISLHENNRCNLRLLYATQQLLKGKTLEEIEPHNREATTPLSFYKKSLDDLVEKYGEASHNS